MITFEEARTIFQSYPELKEIVSGRRYRYHVKHSLQRGKEVAREIVRNKDGSFNGYINSRYMTNSQKQKYVNITDSRQMILLRKLTHDQLHDAIRDAIQSMTCKPEPITYERFVKESKIQDPAPSKISNDNSIEKLARPCLYNWLGYGNPKGKVWFIGTEEGGAEIWRQQTKTLEESLQIRSNFKLHMDFQDVWENQYEIPLSSFHGGTVWNFIAAFLLNLNGYEANSITIRNFIYNKKLLGRKDGDHYLCELFPLPKQSKNFIDPYENVWNSINNYHNEVLRKRLDLIKNTIKIHTQIKIIVSYEQSLVELLKQDFADSITQLSNWDYGKQKYSLFQLILDSTRTILLLSTPFFGQGQINYDGIENSVNHIKEFL